MIAKYYITVLVCTYVADVPTIVETSSTVRRNGKRLVRIELKDVSGGDGIYEHKPQVGAMCIE